MFFIGGCSGSTAGGFKVVRWMILAKRARTQMLEMLHPHGVFSVRVNGSAGREDLFLNIASFFFIYLFVIVWWVSQTVPYAKLLKKCTFSQNDTQVVPYAEMRKFQGQNGAEAIYVDAVVGVRP